MKCIRARVDISFILARSLWKLKRMVAVLPQSQNEVSLRFQSKPRPGTADDASQGRIVHCHNTRVDPLFLRLGDAPLVDLPLTKGGGKPIGGTALEPTRRTGTDGDVAVTLKDAVSIK
jgi:hypothetical protein